MVGCRAWISARITLSAGNGHVWSPMTPMMALHARLSTNRYSTRKRIACLLAGGLAVGARHARVVTPVRLRGGHGGLHSRLLPAPRYELTVRGDRDGTTEGSRAVPSRDPVLRDGRGGSAPSGPTRAARRGVKAPRFRGGRSPLACDPALDPGRGERRRVPERHATA